MSARIATGVLVNALIRQVQATGGQATVLAKGDATSGALLLVVAERGVTLRLLERVLGADGYAWVPTGPPDLDEPGAVTDYLARRRRFDPDLWAVEIDGRDVEAVARALLG